MNIRLTDKLAFWAIGNLLSRRANHRFDPAELEKRIKLITGVVDSGIFARVAHSVISAGPSGIRKRERKI